MAAACPETLVLAISLVERDRTLQLLRHGPILSDLSFGPLGFPLISIHASEKVPEVKSVSSNAALVVHTGTKGCDAVHDHVCCDQ
jgi:hypothetical protein